MMQNPDAYGVTYNTLQWQKHYLEMNAATKGGPYQTPTKKKKTDNNGGDLIHGVDKEDDEFSEVRTRLNRTPAQIHNEDNNFEEFYTLDKEESDDPEEVKAPSRKSKSSESAAHGNSSSFAPGAESSSTPKAKKTLH